MRNRKRDIPLHEKAMESRERAIETLRTIARVDVDRYLEQISPQVLLKTPIGPTSECLTIDALGEYSTEAMTFKPLAPHLSKCSECYNALRIYQAVKERALDPVAEERPILWLETDDPIKLTLEPVRFDLTLHSTTVYALAAARLSVVGVFDHIDCQDVVVLESDELAGSTYRAQCVARPSAKLIQTLEPGTEFCDWIRVFGKTDAGEQFAATDLVRFHFLGK